MAERNQNSEGVFGVRIRYLDGGRRDRLDGPFVGKSRYSIGRAKESDIVLDSDWDSAGRDHASLVREGGRAFIVDRDTRNGTFVNDNDIGARGEVVANDIIRFGNEGPRIQIVELTFDGAPEKKQERGGTTFFRRKFDEHYSQRIGSMRKTQRILTWSLAVLVLVVVAGAFAAWRLDRDRETRRQEEIASLIKGYQKIIDEQKDKDAKRVEKEQEHQKERQKLTRETQRLRSKITSLESSLRDVTDRTLIENERIEGELTESRKILDQTQSLLDDQIENAGVIQSNKKNIEMATCYI